MPAIPMVDLHAQYLRIKNEVDDAIAACISSSNFIGGKAVAEFEDNLSKYLKIKNVIGCGNGTDALLLALLALDLPRGSRIIVPAFTYIAPVEAICMAGHVPVYADIDENTFNISLKEIRKVYTEDLRAIIAVHLFGQPCDMDEILQFAQEKKIAVIEDNAQSLGSEKSFNRNSIITTSFFPSKNLGAYGDGGAVMTNDNMLAEKIRKLANHGQRSKYYHDVVGMNSRLDAIQAAILNVKLKYLDEFIQKRVEAADYYAQQLSGTENVITPFRKNNHCFHQYTIRITDGARDEMAEHLTAHEISSAIFYPLPCYKQQAYLDKNLFLPVSEKLALQVLSLPLFPEITRMQQDKICNAIRSFASAKFQSKETVRIS